MAGREKWELSGEQMGLREEDQGNAAFCLGF